MGNNSFNLKYLTETIIPLRKKEIEEGKNLATSNPIYVVLDLVDCYCSGHNEYSPTTNEKNKEQEHGYLDMSVEAECRKFFISNDGMKEPEEATRFYIDKVVAFFFCSEHAYDYLEYQKHNLRDPYVYVFHAGYRNWEAENLFNGK